MYAVCAYEDGAKKKWKSFSFPTAAVFLFMLNAEETARHVCNALHTSSANGFFFCFHRSVKFLLLFFPHAVYTRMIFFCFLLFIHSASTLRFLSSTSSSVYSFLHTCFFAFDACTLKLLNIYSMNHENLYIESVLYTYFSPLFLLLHINISLKLSEDVCRFFFFFRYTHSYNLQR